MSKTKLLNVNIKIQNIFLIFIIESYQSDLKWNKLKCRNIDTLSNDKIFISINDIKNQLCKLIHLSKKSVECLVYYIFKNV